MGLVSLKAKMTTVVSLLVAGMLAIMALLGLRYFERQFRETVERHQFATVAVLAEEIDSKLLAAQSQLLAVARSLPPALLADREQAGVYLAGQGAALETFDNGLFLFSATGRLLAGTRMEPHMQGRDYSFREYYRVTTQTGRPYISRPFFSSQKHGHPIVMLTAPIPDGNGGMAALLAGSLDLLGENFLSRLVDHRIGERGYLFLFSTDRTMILHPDRERILQNDVPPGVNRLFDRAVAGFEGSGETVNSRGLHALSSFKRLRSTNWILGANFPLADAYAPIVRARQYFLAGLAAMLVLSTLTVWLFMRHLTLPLRAITGRARQIAGGRMVAEPLPVASRDEVGLLAGAFNRMLAVIDEQQRAVEEEKEFAKALIEHSAAPAFVIDRQHRVLLWNRACEELTGLRAADVQGSDGPWRAFYDRPRPCLADLAVSGQREALAEHYEVHARSPLVEEGLQAEGWRTLADGRRRYLIFNAAPIRNRQGEVVAAIQTLEDFTARREAETRLEHLAHSDPLTGLPNRTLFFDRLAQGVATASRYGHCLALLYIDLDGFKQVNDGGGHAAGDRVLAEVAQRLKGCVRDSDTVARVGGDEFAVILGRVAGAGEAAQVAERVLAAMAEPIAAADRLFSLGASIGISLCPDDGGEAGLLLSSADAAMYRVKAAGKSHYAFCGTAARAAEGRAGG